MLKLRELLGTDAATGIARTDEEEADWLACLADSAVFIDRHCVVQSDTGEGLVPFRLYPYQVDLLADFRRHRQVIILKARQLGVTELVAAYAVWKALRPYQTIVAISQGEDEAGELVRKARMAWDHLPAHLRIPLKNPRLLSTLEFANGSRIIPKPATSRSGRTYAAHLLIIDEWASQIDPAGVYEAAAPAALSAGNQVIGISTARQAGDFFHEQWQLAEEGRGAHPVFLPYHVRPGHDEAWRAEQTRTFQGWQRRRAYPAEPSEAFTLSGRPRFDQAALSAVSARCVEPARTEQLGTDGHLHVWAEPAPGARYVCGADTAEGLPKGDYDAAVVLDHASGREVAELHGHWPPDVFAHHLAALCAAYNTCLLGVERNNHGHAVLLALRSIERYTRLYRHVEYDQRGNAVGQAKDGWATTSKSKPIMIDSLARAIREMGEGDRAPFANRAFVAEARTYAVLDSGDTGASGSLNDDRIVAYAIAERMRAVPDVAPLIITPLYGGRSAGPPTPADYFRAQRGAR